MPIERVPCRNPDCGNTILPVTARVNDGYCMPCVHQRRAQEREQYIRAHRREEDPYAGLTDLVEIIRVFHTPRPHDPLIVYRPAPKSLEDLYSQLTAQDAARLMVIAAQALRSGEKDFADSIAKSLATLTSFPLDDMLPAWIQQNHLWPSVVFRGACDYIRDGVANALQSGRANPNHALRALAWIGDATVQKLFQTWETNPPPWRETLFVGPAQYAQVAAWALVAGCRHDLFHESCWAVTLAAPHASPEQSLQLMHETNQTCPWCRRSLTYLIDLDLRDKRFAFFNFPASFLRILTCDVCTAYGPFFSRIAFDGSARFAEENVRPQYLPEDGSSWERSPWQGQKLHLPRRGPLTAVDWCMPVSLTQIGGLPAWVQSPEFPACLDCTQPMDFVAQVDNAAFPWWEGMYYAFLCAPCRVAATVYQQS